MMKKHYTEEIIYGIPPLDIIHNIDKLYFRMYKYKKKSHLLENTFKSVKSYGFFNTVFEILDTKIYDLYFSTINFTKSENISHFIDLFNDEFTDQIKNTLNSFSNILDANKHDIALEQSHRSLYKYFKSYEAPMNDLSLQIDSIRRSVYSDLAMEYNYKVEFSFNHPDLRNYILSPNIVLFHEAQDMYFEDNRKKLFNLFPKQVLKLTLNSLSWLCNGYSQFLKYMDFNSMKKSIIWEMKTFLRMASVTPNWNTYLNSLLLFFTELESTSHKSLFEEFKLQFNKLIKSNFDRYNVANDVVDGQPGSWLVDLSEELDNYQLVLDEWVKYWKSHYNAPYNPEIFFYFLMNYLKEGTGLFKIAGPPGSNVMYQFGHFREGVENMIM